MLQWKLYQTNMIIYEADDMLVGMAEATNIYTTILRGFLCLRSLFFWFKNASTLLCLSKDKIKRQSGKNTTLTPTKTLPNK